MSLTRKVLLLVGGLALLLFVSAAALGTAGLLSLAGVDRAMLVMKTDALPGSEAMGILPATLYRFRGDAWRHISVRSPEEKRAIDTEMTALKSEFDAQLSAYDATIHVEEDRANSQNLHREAEAYFQAWAIAQPVSAAGDNERAGKLYLERADAPFRAVRDRLMTMLKWNYNYADQSAKAAVESGARGRSIMWSVLVGVVLVAGVICTVLAILLNRLTRELVGASKELDVMADQVASAATQISSASQSLAQGTSEQAASLEETSSSSTEINSMADANKQHSEQAAQLVAESQVKFTEANRSLGEMVTAMDEINTQSARISKILKVIDEIAFQTNILALNAAVEAARAGEAGMGFAVVADEVRNLAQRCAQASRDTAELVEESIAKSNAGKLKVDHLAAVLGGVTAASDEIHTLVGEVNAGSREQSDGISQIARAIHTMQQVTQHSAASAEESASAAEELSAQSHAMRDVVNRLSAMVAS